MSGSRGPLSQPRGLKIVKTDAPLEPETLADEVVLGAPAKPEDMFPAEIKLWDTLVPQLEDLGLVTTVDGLTIDLALRHYLAALQASAELEESQTVAILDDKNGRMQKHPADAVFRLHSEMYLKYAGQLGMTYVSRARLAARGTGGETENPFGPDASAAAGSS